MIGGNDQISQDLQGKLSKKWEEIEGVLISSAEDAFREYSQQQAGGFDALVRQHGEEVILNHHK